MGVRIRQLLPMIGWLSGYQGADLSADARAGLTTAVVLVPQGMAYAMLAGLDPVLGLYAALLPLLVYALFGTSGQLAVGPVAMVSLMVGSAVDEHGGGLATAVILAGMVGLLQLAMGLGRLGFLTRFLSHPVLSGFTSAAALVIAASQLRHLLGLELPRSPHFHETVVAVGSHLGQTDALTLVVGVVALALLVGLKRLSPLIPAALVVVVLGTLAVWLLGLDQRGVAVVGQVPPGLPSLGLPETSLARVQELLPAALTIALVGYMESIAVARSLARKHRTQVDPDQELVALGLANLGSSLTGTYPVAGGFGRSAVNDVAGARTPVASAITAALVGLVLLFLTPLLTLLPKAVLAAIIIKAVLGLVDLAELSHLWRVKRADLVVLGLTFIATLAAGFEVGISVGVGWSILGFLARTSRPHLAVLGRIPGTRQYRNLERHPEAETTPGVLVVRMDAQLYFANTTYFRDALRELESELDQPLRAVVVDASAINQLDSSADAMLRALHQEYEARGIQLVFAGTKGPVLDVMRSSGLCSLLGAECLCLDVEEAVQVAKAS